MKILSLSTFDSQGGAVCSTYRLHQALRNIGIDISMLVSGKSTADPHIIPVSKNLKTLAGFEARFAPGIDRQPLKLQKHYLPTYPWSLNWFPNALSKQVRSFKPDIIHLNWIGQGFVPIQALAQFNCPLIWTFHDSWAFTGGCHIPNDCIGYRTKCGHCPQLGSTADYDLSRWIWNRKNKYWNETNLTIITPSHWLANCARSSSLFANRRIETIPNGLDLGVYQPVDKLLARRLLKLPADKKLILFGAFNSTTDKNKGFHLLQAALHHLVSEWGDSAELVIFGASETAASPNLGLKSHYLGYLHDDVTLALMYSAADVVVVPSIQENLPNTIMEAFACGTPSVGFHIGGIPDLIEHQKNGYLVQPFDVEELASGISWVIKDETRWRELSSYARHKAEDKFDIARTAENYTKIYESVLSSIA